MTHNRFAVLCARARVPLVWGGALLLLLQVVVVETWPDLLPAAVERVLAVAAPVLFVLGMLLYLRVGTVRTDPVELSSPVTGRWLAMNSPGSRVPSHGLHAYGQSYAIDLVHEPVDQPRPRLGWWPLSLPADRFAGFGAPVRSPADGVVVRVHDRQRDHRSRTSWPSLAYLLVEAAIREFLGSSRILGNHVVVDLGDGRFAALAHLRRGSVAVLPGQRVRAGEPVAECGNSGNSTEPHLHLQVMDHPQAMLAAGLPFRLTEYTTDDGRSASGVPANGEALTAAVG
jgi:hypothetical protein